MKKAGPLNRADFHFAFIWQTGWFSARLLIHFVSEIIMKIEKSAQFAGLKSLLGEFQPA